MKKDEIELLPKDLPGGGKSIIAWCRPLWAHGADARRPLRLEVTAEVQAPGPTGMPEGPEELVLENIGHKVESLATKRGRADHVMTVTGAAKRTWIFYLPERVGVVKKRDVRPGISQGLDKIAEAFDRELAVTWAEDPDWSTFLGIFSVHDPAQWKQDHAMMIHMAKARDAIHVRRQVAHRMLFDERAQCRDFLREVRRLKVKSEGGPKQRSDGRFDVVVTRLEPTIAVWHLHPVVLSIKTVALAHGGSYEGWETEFVESTVPPPLTAPAGG